MADTTGVLKDIVGQPMADRVAELRFRLNAPNVQTAAGTVGLINPTAEVSVVPHPTSGFFMVALEPTTVMLFDAWYEMGIVWQGTEEPLWDYPQWQIRVPPTGGAINDLAVMGAPGGWGGPLANLSLVLVSPTQPDNLQRGQLWLQMDPDNPSSAQSTGDLYRGV